jgi:hypothetical protein
MIFLYFYLEDRHIFDNKRNVDKIWNSVNITKQELIIRNIIFESLINECAFLENEKRKASILLLKTFSPKIDTVEFHIDVF